MKKTIIRPAVVIAILALVFTSCSSPVTKLTNAEKLGYPQGSKVLLLHCDDAGMCEEANIAVMNYFKTGDIRSAAIMVPCPYAEDLVEWALTQDSPDIGIHLTQTSEWKDYRWGPVSDTAKVPGLIDPEGKMWHDVPDVVMHATAAEVETEVRAQIDKVLGMGFIPSHIDTHMGTMYGSAEYLKVFLKIANEYNLPANAIDLSDPAVAGMFKSQGYPIDEGVIGMLDDYSLPKLDFFSSVPDGSSYENKRDNFFALVKGLEPGLTEIIFHPSVETENLKSITGSWQQRVWEARLFSDPDVKKFFEENGIIITTWREIMNRHNGLSGPEALPRSTPEAEGVNSQGIIDFLRAAEKGPHEFHSLMVVRHGKVIAEGWWSPYAPDLKHTLYSTSKSFTSTAVGFAVSENRLKVTDKVISFFPEYLPDTVSPFLADMEVKDLLSMSAGQVPDPTGVIPRRDTNWVKAFLATPVVRDPGSEFLYNSMATYMCSAIVQKITGGKVIDYLEPRLFDPLGIKGMDWEIDPQGINTGGWGLRLKTEDMAKFGQLYLQKGIWKGKEIIPEAWVDEATTLKIYQAPDAPQSLKDSSDWMQGYCYQFWRCRNNAFRGDGAYGQYIVVMPEKDAVVAITCESPDLQGELNMVWKYLLPAFSDEALPENPELNNTLSEMLSSLEVKNPPVRTGSKLQPQISGKKYTMDPNQAGVESLELSFPGNQCKLLMKTRGSDHIFSFGDGYWSFGITARPGPNLLLTAKGHMTGIPPVKTAGMFSWKDNNTLELTLRYIESPHTETFTFVFDSRKADIDTRYSFMPGANLPRMTGTSNN